MINLPETQHSLFELQSSFDFRAGLHTTDAIRATNFGVQIGHIDFDPAKHDMTMVDPTAEAIDDQGWPQVPLAEPYNRLGMNVMVYANLEQTSANYLKAIDEAKRVMAVEIAESLGRLRLTGDRTRLLVIGKADDFTDLPQSEVADLASSPTRATAEIVERSKRSEINFLESDFVLLDPDDLPVTGNTIAIKLNHPMELELPAKKGRFTLGGLEECNTNKPAELDKTNSILSSRHEAILSRLGAKGVEVVSLSYDPNYANGVNSDTLDAQLSQSVNNLARARR